MRADAALPGPAHAAWPILSNGFRPFFLAAALWSVLALALWIGAFAVGWQWPTRFDPLAWHTHEMLFGFVMAAIAGFLLTAIPNWTKRPPVRGAALGLLVALWAAGRAACLISALLAPGIAAAIDIAFPVALAAVAAHEIAAGRNWRNLTMVAPLLALGVSDLAMHLEAAGFSLPAGLGWRFGLAAILVLVSVIGGRIIPSFTRNWLVQRAVARLPAAPDLVDRLALGSLHAGLFLWALAPALPLTGYLLLFAAAMNGWRLMRWRGGATRGEPLLLILHIGYGWLVAGAFLLGLTLAGAGIPESAAIHAFTAGSIGTMILAVMTRATRGHTGRALSADRVTSLLYLAAQVAAAARILAAIMPALAMPLLSLSACLWTAAFGGFAIRYGSMLAGPRRSDPA